MDVTNADDLGTLKNAIKAGHDRTSKLRESRVHYLEQYVGHHYSDKGSKRKVALNLIQMAIEVFAQQIAAFAPRVTTATHYSELRWAAFELKLALNHIIDEMGLEESLQDFVVDAFFGMGIMKVGVTTEEMDEWTTALHDAGQPYADPVSLDDFSFDPHAKSMRTALFMADRTEILLEDVLANNDFEDKAKKQLQKKFSGSGSKSSSLLKSEEKTSDITQSGNAGDRLYDYIEVWEVWLRREQQVILICDECDHPLHVSDWDGPESGMYEFLGFTKVPDNPLPLPTAANMIDLHEFINTMFRKMMAQGLRQKTITGVRGGADSDGNRVVDAKDGEVIKLEDPSATAEISFGGVHPNNIAILAQTRGMFSYMAGNLDAIGGLGAQTDTVGQEQIISNSAHQKIAKMQREVYKCVRRIIRRIAYYVWHDPSFKIQLSKNVLGLETPFVWSHERREGELYKYTIDIDAVSMQHQTPGMKADSIVKTLNEVVAPYQDQFMQQGMIFDAHAMIETMSELRNLPELKSLFRDMPPSMYDMVMSQRSSRQLQSPHTTRVHERVNRSAATRQGGENALVASMLGAGGTNNQQMANNTV